MKSKNYVVMGAGEVGFHLARSLSRKGHDVTVIEINPATIERIEDELEVRVVRGNGSRPPTLKQAKVGECDLFMAVSSSEEANLTASLIAKEMGAGRTVVRASEAQEVIQDRRLYEDLFGVDLLLSTELLTTTEILNEIRGHNTVAVEYLAGGKIQLRKFQVDSESPLTRFPLREVDLPADSLIVGFFHNGDAMTIPSGDDMAKPGDQALLLGTTEVVGKAERLLSNSEHELGTVVIAGGGSTARTVAKALEPFQVEVKLIERDRSAAKRLSEEFPRYQVIHGDPSELALLKAERIDRADTFAALSAHDETNLMACLMAQELRVPQVLALVQRAETSQLWRRLDLQKVFSPRQLAYQRISDYIDSDYSSNIVSLQRGAMVVERRLAEASPAVGVTLAEMKPPPGLIVGAVARGDRVFVPRGKDRLEVGDLVILFVREEEISTVRLLFPGRERRASG